MLCRCSRGSRASGCSAASPTRPAGAGLVVAIANEEARYEPSFDRSTGELLAEREVVTERRNRFHVRPGTQIGSALYQASCVVSFVRERPRR